MYIEKIETDVTNYLGCTDEEFQIMDLDLMLDIQSEVGGSIYTVHCFFDLCKDGLFTEMDGNGFYHNGFKLTDISVWDKQAQATNYLYVCWFERRLS